MVSLPPSRSSGPGGRAVSGSRSSKVVWAACLPWLSSLPNVCWTFLELVVTASCTASMSASGTVEARSLSAPRPHSNQDSGTIYVIVSFVTPPVSQISPKLPPSWAMMLDSGNPLLTRSPNGRVRSALTSGRVPTLLPMDADFRLASVYSSTHPPAPRKGLHGLFGEDSKSADSPGTPPGQITLPPLLLEDREAFRTLTTPRCQPFCML